MAIYHDAVIPKTRVAVTVVRNDGTRHTGDVFVGPSQRLIDVLNDARGFLPFEAHDGEVIMLAKTAIAAMSVTGDEPERTAAIPAMRGRQHLREVTAAHA